MKKFSTMLPAIIPVLIMIGLIPLIKNDYLLAGIYAVIIFFSFLIRLMPNEIRIFVFGFCIMIFFEYLFISTGVETFNRNSLFGIMPLWLPLLWAYAFVAIKRSVILLNS